MVVYSIQYTCTMGIVITTVTGELTEIITDTNTYQPLTCTRFNKLHVYYTCTCKFCNWQE